MASRDPEEGWKALVVERRTFMEVFFVQPEDLQSDIFVQSAIELGKGEIPLCRRNSEPSLNLGRSDHATPQHKARIMQDLWAKTSIVNAMPVSDLGDSLKEDHDVFAFEPASLVRSDGDIASSTLEAPGSKSSSRPCRRKRMHFKRIVNEMWALIEANPEEFDLQHMTLPETVLRDAAQMAKLESLARKHKESYLASTKTRNKELMGSVDQISRRSAFSK
jgi:hypothetical protein